MRNVRGVGNLSFVRGVGNLSFVGNLRGLELRGGRGERKGRGKPELRGGSAVYKICKYLKMYI